MYTKFHGFSCESVITNEAILLAWPKQYIACVASWRVPEGMVSQKDQKLFDSPMMPVYSVNFLEWWEGKRYQYC